LYWGKLVARGGRKDLGDLFQEFTESAFMWIGLVLVIGVGAWVVSWIRSRLADDEGSQAVDHRLLTQIADLKEQGDLSEEEYRSIKGRLVNRIDDSMSAQGGERPAHQVSQGSESPDSGQPETSEGVPKTRDAMDG
jgi:hypothetical protein